MTEFYKGLLCIYMNAKYVNDNHIDLINPLSQAHNLPVNRINIGTVRVEVLQDPTLSTSEKINFLQCCKNYVRTASDQLKRRLWETENEGTINRSMFHADNATDENYHQTVPNLAEILQKFAPYLEEDEESLVQVEWNKMTQFDVPKDSDKNQPLELFWFRLREFQEAGRPVLKNLADFALKTFLLPNSNASAERLWSKLSLEKTKLRNKLAFSTVRSILLAAEFINNNGGCVSFQPKEELILKLLRPGENSCEIKIALEQKGMKMLVIVDQLKMT